MDTPLPVLLENLTRYRREADEAIGRLERQVEACIAAGYDSVRIAAALGCSPANVRSRKAWREARRREASR
jgi:hypothetical protein